MTSCDCCHTEFRWGEILKANFLHGFCKCRNCSCAHKIDFLSRFKVTLLSVVPFLVFGLFLTPFESNFFTILIGLLIFILGMLFTPFVVNYNLTSK
ncbi:TIGR04104 family putative zinc finger protein [Halobacillus rhizosphaerae]|uniref:TIGR04104 family putative zinc finger protein n=1 Tax=Halobacillus rhizosphaerae TaxID=3064889 RepID=UPI00398AA00B